MFDQPYFVMGLCKKVESKAQDGFPFPKWRYKNPRDTKFLTGF
jgi:hypothetical protein